MGKFNKEKFYEDIVYIFNTIKEKHPNLYYKISENELNSLIDSYLKDENINSLDESIYYLNKIFVKIGDSHTQLEDYYNPSSFKFKIINDECIVSKTVNKNELIGATLKSINGIDINQILKELKDIIVPRTEEGINAKCEQYLSNKAQLFILPSIYPNVEIEYTFLKDNKEYNYKENVFNVDYNNFVKPKNYEYEIVDNILVIKYRKCRNMNNYSFKQMVDEISKAENIDGYVVDIRGNEGGNSEIINPLIEFLKDKKVITLVDKFVFSSGIKAYKDLKDIGSFIIGSDIAEKINCFGDILHGETPNYKLRFMYSTKYFMLFNNELTSVYGKKEYDEFFSKKENKKYLDPIYFHPYIYASITKEDIINGRDSVLDLAIENLWKNKVM